MTAPPHLILNIHSLKINTPLTPNAPQRYRDSTPLYIDLRHPMPYSSLRRRISVFCTRDETQHLDIFHDLGHLGEEESMHVDSSDCDTALGRGSGESRAVARTHLTNTLHSAVSIALRYDKKIKMGVHTLFDLHDMNALCNENGEIVKERDRDEGDDASWNCREKCLYFASRWINKAVEMRIRIYKKYPLLMRVAVSLAQSPVTESESLMLESIVPYPSAGTSTPHHATSSDTFILNYNYDERNLRRKEYTEMPLLSNHHQTAFYPVANSFCLDIMETTGETKSIGSRSTATHSTLKRQIIVKMEEFTRLISNTSSGEPFKIRILEGDITRTHTISQDGCSEVQLGDLTLHFERLPPVPSHQTPTPNPALSLSNGEYSNANTYAYPSLIPRNRIEILIDGLQTFSRYYHYMMQAQRTIHIIGWELSLSFGLVYVPTSEDPREVKTNIPHFINLRNFLRKHNLWPQDAQRRWITLQDVLLAKAAQGVKTKIIVWRHNFISMLGRFLYMGEFTIEREVEKLKKKAAAMNIRVEALHYSVPLSPDSEFADPFATDYDADIVVLIVGNPKGIVSCCHEKLVLVDADLPARCVAFTGGFDIARGRFDQPKHLPPKPLFEWRSLWRNESNEERYSGKEVQPFFRLIRMLWHDSQVLVQGPATRTLYLHFAQRWIQSFHPNDLSVSRNLTLPPTPTDLGTPFLDPIHTEVHPCFIKEAPVRVFRQWPTVLQTHVLLDHYCSLIRRAKKYIYIEHQYPFQSFALTHCMCEAIRRNPDLKVIVIAPVKNDLPNGMIGSLLDISNDHIVEHLNMIHRVAPNRFAAYGIVRQEPTSKSLKAVYVHSKLMIVDDEIISIGSSNLDYLSFSQSSEITLEVYSRELCIDTKLRLFQEHLEDFFDRDALVHNFDAVFDIFQQVAQMNYESYRAKGVIIGRPFPMVPHKYYIFALGSIHVPNIVVKALFKFGLTPDSLRKYLPFASLQCCRRRAKKRWIQSRL